MCYVKLFEQWMIGEGIRRDFDYTEQLQALIRAAEEGDFNLVKGLLDDGNIDINYQDENGWTALHHAVFSKSVEVVGFLLSEPEIDLSITDNLGKIAWEYADLEIRNMYPELEYNQFSDTYDEDDAYSRLGSAYDDNDYNSDYDM